MSNNSNEGQNEDSGQDQGRREARSSSHRVIDPPEPNQPQKVEPAEGSQPADEPEEVDGNVIPEADQQQHAGQPPEANQPQQTDEQPPPVPEDEQQDDHRDEQDGQKADDQQEQQGATRRDEEPEEEPEPINLPKEGSDWLEGLFERMGLDVDLRGVRDDGDRLYFNLTGPDVERLLGLGKMAPKALEGIETIMGSVFNQHPDSSKIYVDVDGAREARKKQLQRVASDLAERALNLGKHVTVSGLNSTERRIIHRALRDNDKLETESVGDGVFRRLKISPQN
jgi:spoIIIJ-associated protein